MTGSDALTFEPLDSLIVLALGDGEAQAAGAETEPGDDGHVSAPLLDLIEADDAEGGRSARHDLGNVVVTEIEGFDGEGLRLGEQLPLGSVDLDADALEEGEALFVEPPLGLDGDANHIVAKFKLP